MNIKVLVVDDDDRWKDILKDTLSNKGVDLIFASTIQEVSAILEDNKDLDIIVLSACAPGTIPATYTLAMEIREAFKGPMIASCSHLVYRENLIKIGCNYECEKYLLAQTILDIAHGKI